MALLSGCFGGSLATSTGLRSGGDWSVARRQAAHVGETVRFSFVLTKLLEKHPISPSGIADYCIIALGDQYAEADLGGGGKFMLSYHMPEHWADREIRVLATAYRIYGRRDRMVIGGELMQVDNASDPADKIIARASINMLVYQSRVELTLPRGAHDFDFGTGRLIIRKNDGTASTAALARPPIGGFTVDGPDEKNVFTARFEPRHDQVNRTGSTTAEFHVWDLAGHQHSTKDEFMTP
ncbi:MAG: hypothetical protein KAV82_05120 [Phycisphaerae bacterium]|nr:hypothetical protein [Phycisphaerae bacterium]